MATREDKRRYYQPFSADNVTEELEITKLIYERLKKESCLESSERQTIAYRIAEIMVAAKQLYTKSLPRLINVGGESDSPMEDDLAGLQMTFVHLCDLMYDYDSAYLQALGHPEPSEKEGAAGLDGNEIKGTPD